MEDESRKWPIFEQKDHFKTDQSKFRLYEAISTVKAQFLHEQQNMVGDFSKISQNFPKMTKIFQNFEKRKNFEKLKFWQKWSKFSNIKINNF